MNNNFEILELTPEQIKEINERFMTLDFGTSEMVVQVDMFDDSVQMVRG